MGLDKLQEKAVVRIIDDDDSMPYCRICGVYDVWGLRLMTFVVWLPDSWMVIGN